MPSRLPAFIVLSIMLAVAACASDPTRAKTVALDDALRGYAATIRWGEIERAQAFVDPAWLADNPLGSIERARYQQVRVSGYTESQVVRVSADEVRQSVEIVLINQNTQGVRSIVDHQVWRYDAKAQRWWLTTGLPDITAQR